MPTEMLRGSIGTLSQDGNIDALMGTEKRRSKAPNSVATSSEAILVMRQQMWALQSVCVQYTQSCR